MSRKYLENLDQEGGDVVPAGEYTVEVVDARAIEDKPTIWLDLKIIGGPDDGRVVSVTLFVPEDGSKAIFFFKRKVRGFLGALAEANVWRLPDDEQPAAIAEAVIGLTVSATLSVQSGGDYDGSQQLDETAQLLVPNQPAPRPSPPQAPAPAEAVPEPEPVPVGASADEDLPF